MQRRSITPSQNGHPASHVEEDAPNEVDLKLARVNELWSKLERKLIRRQPPRHIAVMVQSRQTGEDGNYMEREFLGLQRQHGKWRVCYAVDYPPCEEDGSCDFPIRDLPWKSIAECDLETRVRMSGAKYLDMLKFEIDNTRTFFIPQLDTAISQLEDALDDA